MQVLSKGLHPLFGLVSPKPRILHHTRVLRLLLALLRLLTRRWLLWHPPVLLQ